MSTAHHTPKYCSAIWYISTSVFYLTAVFGSPWGPFWGFGSPFYVLGPLFFNFRLKNLGKMCHICIFFRNYSKWIGEGEGLMLQWPENIRIRWVLLVVKVIQYNVHFQYFRYIRNHIFSFTMHFLLYNATTVWLSRPDISGPARISGHLGKIARITPGFLWFCPDFCGSVHVQSVIEPLAKRQNNARNMP